MDKSELEQLKDKYFRALADLDNLRKRSLKEREELLSFGNESLILELLPIADSFERAFKMREKDEKNEEIVKGIALIKKQFEDVLSRAGVSVIDALDKPFDPNLHEAIMKRASEGREQNTVLEVAQTGYTLNGKVIRPAMVVISE